MTHWTLAILLGIGLVILGTHPTSSLSKVDLFDIRAGKAILVIENSPSIQGEVNQWLQSIAGISDRESLLDFKEGYCLRIPTAPINVKNKWINTTTDTVFLYLDPSYEPVLLIFDIKWPNRYLVRIKSDVRPLLRNLGIWEKVKTSFPQSYNHSHRILQGELFLFKP